MVATVCQSASLLEPSGRIWTITLPAPLSVLAIEMPPTARYLNPEQLPVCRFSGMTAAMLKTGSARAAAAYEIKCILSDVLICCLACTGNYFDRTALKTGTIVVRK